MSKFCVTCVIVFIAILLPMEPVAGTLRFTQVIFRHGERTPDKAFGLYNEIFPQLWPEGLGELTQSGKKQTYDLGRFLRNRYGGFISNSYNSEDITNWSSAKDRSIKSSLMCMLGLFNGSQATAVKTKMDGSISYTPVPIKTIPKEMDVYLSLDGICPRRDELADQSNIKNFRDFYASNSQIIEYLYNHTGEEFLKDPLADVASTFKNLIPIFDTVLILYESNIIVEDWINSEFMHANIPKIRAYQFNVFKRRNEMPESRRLQGGPLVDLITQNFKDFNSGLITQKMISYSSHDKSIYYLMTAMGIYDSQLENLPSYASGLFMELHQNLAQMEPMIEFWYRNETNRQPYHLISSKCGNPCTLSSLVDATSEFANINFDEECKAKGSTQN